MIPKTSLSASSSKFANMSTRKLRGSLEKSWSFDQQQALIKEVRRQVGPIADKFPTFFTDAAILRFLRARNLSTKRASKMMKDTLKWRLEYKPEKIRWEEIACEAETGKIYRANYLDKHGRSVLIMRPGFQNTTSTGGQIRYLIYCMENAIMNLKPGKEQMVWLIDFQKWNMSSISVKVTKETANVLQNRYPERLGLAILYNPPKVFESFWLMVKPFLEPKTYRKVKFVYSNDPQSQKIMEDLFDLDTLESTFGGKSGSGFDFESYAKRMEEEDKKMAEMINPEGSSESNQASVLPELRKSESSVCEPGSVADEDCGSSSNNETGSNSEYGDEERESSPLSCKETVNLEAETAKTLKVNEQA